jgi:hypothetical protein
MPPPSLLPPPPPPRAAGGVLSSHGSKCGAAARGLETTPTVPAGQGASGEKCEQR